MIRTMTTAPARSPRVPPDCRWIGLPPPWGVGTGVGVGFSAPLNCPHKVCWGPETLSRKRSTTSNPQIMTVVDFIAGLSLPPVGKFTNALYSRETDLEAIFISDGTE